MICAVSLLGMASQSEVPERTRASIRDEDKQSSKSVDKGVDECSKTVLSTRTRPQNRRSSMESHSLCGHSAACYSSGCWLESEC